MLKNTRTNGARKRDKFGTMLFDILNDKES